jgi:hypothetical protein
MASASSPVRPADPESNEILNTEKVVPTTLSELDDAKGSSRESSESSESTGQPEASLKWKIVAILLVSAIGFGSRWSSGITGAMKSTLKKELHINNTQFALLEASEDFMVTALILFSGLVTDRIGGAGIQSPGAFAGHSQILITRQVPSYTEMQSIRLDQS